MLPGWGAGTDRREQIGKAACAVMTGTQGHGPGLGWGEEILAEPVLKGEQGEQGEAAGCLDRRSSRYTSLDI